MSNYSMKCYLITRLKNNQLEYYNPNSYFGWSEHRELTYQYLHKEKAINDLYSLPEMKDYHQHRFYTIIEEEYQIFNPIYPSLEELKQEHLTKSLLYVCRCEGMILGDFSWTPYFRVFINDFSGKYKGSTECYIMMNNGDDSYIQKDINSVEEGFDILEDLITRTPIFVYKDLDKSWKAA